MSLSGLLPGIAIGMPRSALGIIRQSPTLLSFATTFLTPTASISSQCCLSMADG